ncbi:hypothetical protein QFZ81_003833 [Paenibacillus sp. V4I9]|nr:hypothetical protein [Paenibacillus sp. V4I9]
MNVSQEGIGIRYRRSTNGELYLKRDLGNRSSGDPLDVTKLRELDRVVDGLKDRFGNTAIIRASSLMKAGLATDRAGKIGGHFR